MCYVIGLWLFYRSHADLGTNWSITLEVREGHRLITQGVYRGVRHPMYSALVSLFRRPSPRHPELGGRYSRTWSRSRILFALRVGAEERMMAQQFGNEYAAYTARTKRLIPRSGRRLGRQPN